MRRLLRFRLLRLLLLGLILMLVMSVSAVTAMRFAIHGREVLVPKFVGVKQADAQRSAADNGLLLSIDDRFFSTVVSEGGVLSQSPAAGERVRRGTRVHVALSLGAPKTEVPSLIGQSLRAAQINVQRRGLDISDVSAVSLPNGSEGEIIGQAPPPNASATSPKVSVLVATAPAEQFFLMPDLSGKQLAEVAKQIEDEGFQLKVSTAAAPDSPNPAPPKPEAKRGIIVKQTPAAGHRIPAKSTITLEVAAQ